MLSRKLIGAVLTLSALSMATNTVYAAHPKLPEAAYQGAPRSLSENYLMQV